MYSKTEEKEFFILNPSKVGTFSAQAIHRLSGPRTPSSYKYIQINYLIERSRLVFPPTHSRAPFV
jgi:hypothetical protein